MTRPPTHKCQRCARHGELARVDTPAGKRFLCVLCRTDLLFPKQIYQKAIQRHPIRTTLDALEEWKARNQQG